LVIPSDSEDYKSQKNIFQRRNEKLSFSELAQNKNDPQYLVPEKKHKLTGWIGELFSLFNLPPILLTKFIIQKKVSQKIFTGSIKIAALILLFPFWFAFIFVIFWMTIGIKWALIVLAIQIISLVLRRELVRYNH